VCLNETKTYRCSVIGAYRGGLGSAKATLAAGRHNATFTQTTRILRKCTAPLEAPVSPGAVCILSRPVSSVPATVLHHSQEGRTHPWMASQQGGHHSVLIDTLLQVAPCIVAAAWCLVFQLNALQGVASEEPLSSSNRQWRDDLRDAGVGVQAGGQRGALCHATLSKGLCDGTGWKRHTARTTSCKVFVCGKAICLSRSEGGQACGIAPPPEICRREAQCVQHLMHSCAHRCLFITWCKLPWAKVRSPHDGAFNFIMLASEGIRQSAPTTGGSAASRHKQHKVAVYQACPCRQRAALSG
jgi:hypothetical protein